MTGSTGLSGTAFDWLRPVTQNDFGWLTASIATSNLSSSCAYRQCSVTIHDQHALYGAIIRWIKLYKALNLPRF